MSLLKKLFPFLFLASFFSVFFLHTPVFAENEFSIDADVVYEVQGSGKTLVIQNIFLENNFSNLYATSYTLTLENIVVENARALNNSGSSYETEITKNNNSTNIKVTFPDASLGKGTKRNFKIIYENPSFAIRTGEVWEISIPRLGDQNNFRNYSLTLKIPKSFGLEAYISPKPIVSELSESGYTYTFSKNDILQTGVSAGYGQFQVFSFNLSYHLENPLAKSSTTQIAIPPDTAFQKVYIQNINPKPSNVTVDPDGNWIATYDLEARQRVDVVVTGAVQIFASYRSFTKPDEDILNENLKETEYWQISSPKIRELAKKLITPKAIYDYVYQNLHYDFSRVQANVQRMGAVAALENPGSVICMEFTDLFIAIARAAGIPAREIEGFAYTENPDLQPLGLVADVLHSWPEYYDRERNIWVPVDPTWASTSGGVDYFNKLDLRHFAFVIHGQSSTQPYPAGSYKLGSNPQKDVYVSFGQLPISKLSNLGVSIKPYRTLPFFSSIYSITVHNPGPVAVYSVYPTIYYDSEEKNREFIEVLPPFSSEQIYLTLPYSILGKDTPNIIKVVVDSSRAEVITNKKQVIVHSLLVISVFLIILTLLVLIRIGKIKPFVILSKSLPLREENNEKHHPEKPKDKTTS